MVYVVLPRTAAIALSLATYFFLSMATEKEFELEVGKKSL
jgi:hypothetical protein